MAFFKKVKHPYRYHVRSAGTNITDMVTFAGNPQDECITTEFLRYAAKMARKRGQPWDPRNVSLTIYKIET